ncbi:Uncharacterised protein [Chlamydia trachomatis]|nr:Uncharacterised protein [Chlamydia trachomatis]
MTIDPLFLVIMYLLTERDKLKTPVELTENILAQSLSLNDSIIPVRNTPATLTSVSMGPISFSI